jgi:vesicle-associated membrane protein 7
MSQPCLTFSLILNDDNECLGAYPTSNKKLKTLLVDTVAKKLSSDDHKRKLTAKTFNIFYIRKGGFLFFCVADLQTCDRIVWNFLDDLEVSFMKSDMKKCTELIKEKLIFHNDPQNDSINRVQNKVNSLKELMISNIEKLLDRGEKLQDMEDITNEIADSAKEFQRGSNQVLWNMRKRTAIVVTVLIAILVAIIVLIVFVACGFPSFYKCSGSSSSH